MIKGQGGCGADSASDYSGWRAAGVPPPEEVSSGGAQVLAIEPKVLSARRRGLSGSVAAPTLEHMSSVLVVAGLASSLDATLGRLQRGHGDPTLRRVPTGWWRAVNTPDGPGLSHFERSGDDVLVQSFGDGADWARGLASGLVGADDHPELFTPDHAVLAGLLRRRTVRLGRTGVLAESLAASIIEQRVTGAEAFTSIRRLIKGYGTAAPGAEATTHPAHGMYASPTAEQWAAIPSWQYLQAGVDEGRSATVRRALTRAAALERVLARHASDPVTDRGEVLDEALRTLSGVGVWTAAKVRQQVLGDPDAWSVDDYHVPGMISAHLGGEPDEALEVFRPHRYRVEVALMMLGMPERHGPRRSLPTHLPVRGGWGRHGR